MRHSDSGFTLIELMVVVAIVGILSAVAIPSYQHYVLKTQTNRVVGELSNYKSRYEASLAGGRNVTNAELAYTPSSLTNGTIGNDIGILNADGSGQLEVTMGGNAHPHLAGVVVRFERASNGMWTCLIDPSAASKWQDDLGPKGCSVI